MNEKICFYIPPSPDITSYYDMIDTAVEYNLKCIEGFCNFEFETPDIAAAEKIREYADSKNIKFACFSVYINLVGDDCNEMIERMKGYAHVASILGSPYLHHTIANDFFNPQNIIPHNDEYFSKGIKAVREIYDYAEALGIKAIYENQGYVFNGVEAFGKFLHEVNRNVGVVADFGNIYQADDKIENFINAFSDRIVHVHIKDVALSNNKDNASALETRNGNYMTEVEIGTGDIDFKNAIFLLKSKGYDGYFAIEYGAAEENSPIIDRTLNLINSWI